MTISDKFAQFNLTEQAIVNFKYIAELHASKNATVNPFIIETKVIGGQENQSKKVTE